MQDFFHSGCPELSGRPVLKRDGRRGREQNSMPHKKMRTQPEREEDRMERGRKRTAAKKRRSFLDRTDENQFSVKAFMSSSVRFSLAELA